MKKYYVKNETGYILAGPMTEAAARDMVNDAEQQGNDGLYMMEVK